MRQTGNKRFQARIKKWPKSVLLKEARNIKKRSAESEYLYTDSAQKQILSEAKRRQRSTKKKTKTRRRTYSMFGF